MDHSPGRREAQDVGDREEQGHDEQVVLGEQVEAHFVRFSLAGGARDDGTDKKLLPQGEGTRGTFRDGFIWERQLLSL